MLLRSKLRWQTLLWMAVAWIRERGRDKKEMGFLGHKTRDYSLASVHWNNQDLSKGTVDSGGAEFFCRKSWCAMHIFQFQFSGRNLENFVGEKFTQTLRATRSGITHSWLAQHCIIIANQMWLTDDVTAGMSKWTLSQSAWLGDRLGTTCILPWIAW